MNVKPTLLASAIAMALVVVASPANAAGVFQEFTVSEGSVVGTPANTFVADKLNGGYTEALTIYSDLSFASSAFGNFGQFYFNDGTASYPNGAVPDIYLNAPGEAGYKMYTVFSSSGQLTSSGFVGSLGAFYLYIDPNKDTSLSLGATGADAVQVSGNSDDYLIASSSSATTLIGLPGTPGAYDFIFKDFALTNKGEEYFSAPIPFHAIVNVNGDFDAFNDVVNDVNSRVGNGTWSTTTYKGLQGNGLGGDMSAVFPIPEPASLALVGLGLLGAGVFRRRKM